MITDINYFAEISNLVAGHKKEILLLKKCSIKDFSKENIAYRFNEIFRSFPYEVEISSNDLGFSYYTIELFDLYYEIPEYGEKIDNKRIEASKNRFKNSELDTQDNYLLVDIIKDFFHALVYSYDLF